MSGVRWYLFDVPRGGQRKGFLGHYANLNDAMTTIGFPDRTVRSVPSETSAGIRYLYVDGVYTGYAIESQEAAVRYGYGHHIDMPLTSRNRLLLKDRPKPAPKPKATLLDRISASEDAWAELDHLATTAPAELRDLAWEALKSLKENA